MMLPNELEMGGIGGVPTAHSLQKQYSQMVERKDAFNQNANNLRKW